MEIKKAFEQMKKDLAKEVGISGGFTMSAKQIKNRTATYCVCNNIPYEEQIAREKASDERVQGYTTWTDEEKANSHARSVETVKRYEARLAEFGTKENEAKVKMERIVNSKAFKKFSDEVGGCECNIEQMDIAYYIRFNY